jgi:hypothetical protein
MSRINNQFGEVIFMSRRPHHNNITRIILFRFHKNAAVCINRLELLQKLNPEIEIFGLYGGPKEKLNYFKKTLDSYLKNIYYVKGKSANWKWQNSDLAVRQWYKNYGKKLSFDTLYIIEWDLLMLAPISEVYKHIPKNAIGLTSLVLLKKIQKHWDPWMTDEPYKSQWPKLLRFAKDKYGYNKKSYASLGGGACLPRKFLQKYAAIDVPELCHDELRLPLFAQIFGINMLDTKLYRRSGKEGPEVFFNAEDDEIKQSIIKRELAKPSGRRVFHPIRKVWRPA